MIAPLGPESRYFVSGGAESHIVTGHVILTLILTQTMLSISGHMSAGTRSWVVCIMCPMVGAGTIIIIGGPNVTFYSPPWSLVSQMVKLIVI